MRIRVLYAKTGLHKSHLNLWPRLTNMPYFSSLYLSFANVVINSDIHTMFAATLFTMGTGKFQAAFGIDSSIVCRTVALFNATGDVNKRKHPPNSGTTVLTEIDYS